MQATLIVGQFAPSIWPFLHAESSHIAWAGMISALQGWLAYAAHGSNPDGTPATVAYQPDQKK